MLFYSSYFLLFFPLVVLFYYLVPRQLKPLWLLMASCYFYLSWNPEYFILVLVVTVISWGTGLLLSLGRKRQWSSTMLRLYLVSSVTFCVGVLISIKYDGFVLETMLQVVRFFGVPIAPPDFDIILPVGLSFYSFQAVGYLADVYQGKIEAEKDIMKYALFLLFFPKLVSGPIERGGDLLPQLKNPPSFSVERVRDGLLLMGWGFFQKLVIADRIAIPVTEVFDHYTDYTGMQIVVAMVLFAFQIYCDFAGYSDIAVGAAGILGITLTKNFTCPYLVVSVREFWQNWHRSLMSWLRDYVYIPLGGNRCGRWKKYRNLLVTFAVSGLWHGASWHYVVWGLVNGIYRVMGEVTEPLRARCQKLLHIRVESAGYRIVQGTCTFLLIDFAWLFFRVPDMSTAADMLGHIWTKFRPFSMFDPEKSLGICTLNLPEAEFYVTLVCLVVFIVLDILRAKIALKELLLRQHVLVRAFLYYLLIFGILLFGVYGSSYDASTFLYVQF